MLLHHLLGIGLPACSGSQQEAAAHWLVLRVQAAQSGDNLQSSCLVRVDAEGARSSSTMILLCGL